MKRSTAHLLTISAITLACTLLVTRSASGGARVLCDVIPIGQAASLPWGEGTGWNQPRTDYPGSQLVADTLRLLAPSTPVLVRMETLRRATLYARKFAAAAGPQLGVGRELAMRLMARALDAEANGKGDALALFDAGYFLESLEHWDADAVKDLDGQRWVTRALSLPGSDPAMHVGAMILSRETPRRPGRHYQAVLAASKRAPSLARSVAAIFPTPAP